MAALRLSVPGKPIRLIPLPGEARARGRITNSGGVFGGPIVVGTPTIRDTRPPPPRTVGPRPSTVPRCGRPIRQGPHAGEPCARRIGHKPGECSSPAAVAKDNARRRTRDFG